jgi:MraZ protein
MESLIGEFRNTLDDKGRVSLPIRLRNALAGSLLILTQGLDECLWLYPPDEWRALSRVVMDSTSPFSARSRIIRRRIIGPAQEVEIDRAGRIAVPQSLRDFAGLTKDCIVLGQDDYIEIWDEERYRRYNQATEEEFKSGSEELGAILRRDKGSPTREVL